MADELKPDYNLFQKLAFLKAGGQEPGTSNADRFGQGFDMVSGIINNVLSAKKAMLENSKIGLENKQKQGELVPYRDIAAPLTPANSTIDANTTDEQRKAMDNLYSQREAMGNMTLDQAKQQAGIQNLMAGAGLKGVQQQTGKANLDSMQNAYYNPKDGTFSLQPDADHQLKIKSSQAATEGTKFSLADKKGAETNLTPGALEMYANLTEQKGGELPDNIGMGGIGIKTKIMNRAAEIAAAKGDDGKALLLRQMSLKSGQNELNAIQKNRGVIGSFGKTLDGVNNLLENAANKVGSDPYNTGIPILQRWINAGKTNIAGDVDVNNLNTFINTAQAEYARYMNTVTGGGSVADEATKRVQQNLEGAKTPEQIKGWIDSVRQEKEVRDGAYTSQINELKSGLFDSGAATSSGATPQPAAVQPTVQHATNGVKKIKSLDGGKTWVDEITGKPVKF